MDVAVCHGAAPAAETATATVVVAREEQETEKVLSSGGDCLLLLDTDAGCVDGRADQWERVAMTVMQRPELELTSAYQLKHDLSAADGAAPHADA